MTDGISYECCITMSPLSPRECTNIFGSFCLHLRLHSMNYRLTKIIAFNLYLSLNLHWVLQQLLKVMLIDSYTKM